MADESSTEEEPSIEEILDSIRQIISEDEEDEDIAEDIVDDEPADIADDEPLDQSAIDDMDFDTPAPVPEPVEDEPLDQSAIDDMDFDTPAPEPMEKPEPIEEDVIELTDKVDIEVDLIDEDIDIEADPEPTPEPEPEPEPEPTPAPVAKDTNDNILTGNAESAAFDAISELARKTAIEHNGITLEDIVRSELKPLLRDWLDKNLPVVIERLVREELERVSKRVMED